MTPPARVKVELFESETIMERGRRKITYLVRHNDAWILAGEHPHATVERLSAGPGTVWERRIELELSVGTRLVRIESVPRPEPARDALDYLSDERRSPRRLSRRRELTVNARGDLVEGRENPPGSRPTARRPR